MLPKTIADIPNSAESDETTGDIRRAKRQQLFEHFSAATRGTLLDNSSEASPERAITVRKNFTLN